MMRLTISIIQKTDYGIIVRGELKCLWHQEEGKGNSTHCAFYNNSRCIRCEEHYFLEKIGKEVVSEIFLMSVL